MVRELEQVEEIATNKIKSRLEKFDEKLLPVISSFFPSFSPTTHGSPRFDFFHFKDKCNTFSICLVFVFSICETVE